MPAGNVYAGRDTLKLYPCVPSTVNVAMCDKFALPWVVDGMHAYLYLLMSYTECPMPLTKLCRSEQCA